MYECVRECVQSFVCVWSLHVGLCVCVALLGNHWADPQPFSNTGTASPVLFFFFMCRLLQTQFPWNWPFFGLFSDGLHCKWFLWSLPRAAGGQLKDPRRQRETDSSKAAALPLFSTPVSKPHQHLLFPLKGCLSSLLRHHNYLNYTKWIVFMDCSMLLVQVPFIC